MKASERSKSNNAIRSLVRWWVPVIGIMAASFGCHADKSVQPTLLTAREKLELMDTFMERSNSLTEPLTESEILTCMSFLSDPSTEVTFDAGLLLSRGARHRAELVMPALIETLKREPEPLFPACISSFILMLDPDALPILEKEMETVKHSNPRGYQQFRDSIPFLTNGAENVRRGRPFAHGWKDRAPKP